MSASAWPGHHGWLTQVSCHSAVMQAVINLSLRRHQSGAVAGESKRPNGYSRSNTLEKSSSGTNVAEVQRRVSGQPGSQHQVLVSHLSILIILVSHWSIFNHQLFLHQSSASLERAESREPGGLVRTESLVSDTLSFYSFDGEASSRPSEVSSPKSPRSSLAPESSRDTMSNRTETPTLAYQSQDTDDFSAEPKSSLSRSVSSTSFMSATSEQEDFGLVNLHMQVNKPITESPLLMSSYISHLSQLRCSTAYSSVQYRCTEPVLQVQELGEQD